MKYTSNSFRNISSTCICFFILRTAVHSNTINNDSENNAHEEDDIYLNEEEENHSGIFLKHSIKNFVSIPSILMILKEYRTKK